MFERALNQPLAGWVNDGQFMAIVVKTYYGRRRYLMAGIKGSIVVCQSKHPSRLESETQVRFDPAKPQYFAW
eukprot:scaffold625244_cov25-Prasinocladus_malaysianus.AAC.1